MTEAIIVALIGGAFTLIGVLIANSRSNAITTEQIKQLKEEVKKHNGLIERTYKLEQTTAIHEAELTRHNKRLELLEEEGRQP